jgi:hypothetical protein
VQVEITKVDDRGKLSLELVQDEAAEAQPVAVAAE